MYNTFRNVKIYILFRNAFTTSVRTNKFIV